MGSNLEISMLCDVHPFKTEWKVQVKVLHMWKSFNPHTGSYLEMVLADENVSHLLYYRMRDFCDVY